MKELNCSICGKPCEGKVSGNPKVYHIACAIPKLSNAHKALGRTEKDANLWGFNLKGEKV